MTEDPDEPKPMSVDLVPLTLVPVEVFGGDCQCHEDNQGGHTADCIGWSYGLSDAVAAWSDCNRAAGRIYRVDDIEGRSCEPGETVTIYVPRDQLGFFQRTWDSEPETARAEKPGAAPHGPAGPPAATPAGSDPAAPARHEPA